MTGGTDEIQDTDSKPASPFLLPIFGHVFDQKFCADRLAVEIKIRPNENRRLSVFVDPTEPRVAANEDF